MQGLALVAELLVTPGDCVVTVSPGWPNIAGAFSLQGADILGRLVADQPATEADQDRGACRASRPRRHPPTGRERRHRPDGARHPCCHPQIASATSMRMTLIHVKTER